MIANSLIDSSSVLINLGPFTCSQVDTLSSLSSPWLDSEADEQWHGREWAVGRTKLRSSTGCLITSQLHRSGQSDKCVNPVKCLELRFLEELYPEILTHVVKPPDVCKHRQSKTSHAHPLRAIYSKAVFSSCLLYWYCSFTFTLPSQHYLQNTRPMVSKSCWLLLVLIMNNHLPYHPSRNLEDTPAFSLSVTLHFQQPILQNVPQIPHISRSLFHSPCHGLNCILSFSCLKNRRI